MADENVFPVVEVDATDLARQDSGAVETGQPSGIQKQQWDGYYVNYKFADIHRVIEDALYSTGGFAGINDNGNNGDGTGTGADGYSFNRPLTTELQYIDRDNNTGCPHSFGRMVRSTVNPIFMNEIEATEDDEEFTSFIKNSDGRGNSYFSQQRYAGEQAVAHDVVYQVMDKINDKVRLYSRGITYTNENYFATDEVTGELSQIAFLDHYEYDEAGKPVYAYQRRYYMDGGQCWTSLMWADYEQNKSWKQLDYEDIEGETRAMGITVFCAQAFLVKYEPTSSFIPTQPTFKPVVWKYADYFNENNRHQWLMTKLRNPVGYIFSMGEIKGLNGALGHFIQLVGSADGVFPQEPGYMQPEGGEISINDLERSKKELHDLMSDNGVNVTVSNSAQSADAKQYDYKATVDRLKSTIQMFREMNEWVFEMLKVYLNKPNAEYDIVYPDNFYPEEEITITEAVDLFEKLREAGKMGASEKLLQVVLMKSIGKKLKQEEIEDIETEFETVNRDNDDSDLED